MRYIDITQVTKMTCIFQKDLALEIKVFVERAQSQQKSVHLSNFKISLFHFHILRARISYFYYFSEI